MESLPLPTIAFASSAFLSARRATRAALVGGFFDSVGTTMLENIQKQATRIFQWARSLGSAAGATFHFFLEVSSGKNFQFKGRR